MAKMTLRAARVNVGLDQKTAAKELKVSNKTLGNWENGVSTPKANKIDPICRLYKVNYDDLIFFDAASALSEQKQSIADSL